MIFSRKCKKIQIDVFTCFPAIFKEKTPYVQIAQAIEQKKKKKKEKKLT